MRNKRYLDIVRLLLKQDSYITINEISKQLNVSNKTIRNDLVQIDEWLNENNLELIKKTGVGISINGDKNTKLHVYHEIIDKSKKNIDYLPEARKLFIGVQLILSSNCRIYELADELFVSRATIHKDIQSLIPIFDYYKIKLNRKNNNGISLEGSEKNFRNLLFDFLKKDNGYHIFSQIVSSTSYPCDGSFPFSSVDINDDEIIEFLQVLKKSKNEYLQSLQIDSLIQIILHLLISFIRIQDKHYIHLSDEFIKEFENQSHYDIASQLCNALESHYSNLQFNEMEIRYLQVFLISLQNSEQSKTENVHVAENITTALIQEWENILNYPFSNDKELYKAVLHHLSPAITRFKHGIAIENPLLYDIETIYSNTYQITKQSMHIIEEQLNCQVTDEEIGFFTLHLAASLDRMKQPLKTLLVSNSSVGAVNLLTRKLTTQFPELLITKKINTVTTKDFDFSDIDLILSTSNLTLDPDLPVIVINPLLYDHDIIRLKSVIKSYYSKKNDPFTHQ